MANNIAIISAIDKIEVVQEGYFDTTYALEDRKGREAGYYIEGVAKGRLGEIKFSYSRFGANPRGFLEQFEAPEDISLDQIRKLVETELGFWKWQNVCYHVSQM